MTPFFDIAIVPLRKEHLEVLRVWRNDARTAQYLLTKPRHISPEMQLQWFETVASVPNVRHFIITHGDRPVGHTSVHADEKVRIGRPSLLIGEHEYLGTMAVALGLKQLIDFAFNDFGLVGLTSLVHRDNVNAIELYKAAGFLIPNPTDSNADYLETTLTPDLYIQSKVYHLFSLLCRNGNSLPVMPED